MNIDLNQPFTTQDVKDLIASKDDSVSRQLRVTSAGIAFLSDEIGNIEIEGLTFRFETWLAGNAYTGEAAGNDPAWIKRIEKVLRNNWPEPSEPLIDMF